MDKIIAKASALADVISAKKDELIKNMLSYESFQTAEDEITRSINCLRNVKLEIKYLCDVKLKSVSTFFPLNLPLYSLVLFAVIPALISKSVFVRPPILMRNVLKNICGILEIDKYFPNVSVLELTRKVFLDGYVATSDVVLFTGRYDNAMDILRNYPNKLIIFNGAGINPIIVAKSANLDMAVEKIVKARTFNSGQDCAGPDAIIVHSNIAKDFLEKLKSKLAEINVGEYNDRSVKVGKVLDTSLLEFISKIFVENKENIIFGGKIDFKNGIIYPTIIANSMRQKQSYTELFSPVFFVLIYDYESELDLFFNKESYTDFAMYVSVFGNCDYIQKIKNSVILKNKNILDVEEGNKAYGGYGPKANFAYYDGKFSARPILISKEIREWYLQNNKAKQK